jgi:hypothetical protein
MFDLLDEDERFRRKCGAGGAEESEVRRLETVSPRDVGACNPIVNLGTTTL